MLALIPSSVWDSLAERHRGKKQSKLTVYFDTSCGICERFIRFLSAFVPTHNVMVGSIYDKPHIQKASAAHNSWVGVVGGRRFYRADVLTEIVRRSYVWAFITPLLSTRPIAWLAASIYQFVSSHRHSVCKPRRPASTWQRLALRADAVVNYAGQGAVLVFISVIAVWVVSDIPRFEGTQVSQPFARITRSMRLDQHWNMFSPRPISFNSWPIIRAETVSGAEVDIWRTYWDDGNTELSYERPEHSYDRYVNSRWRRYMTRIQNDGYNAERRALLRYMCTEWNQQNPSNRVLDVQLIQMYEATRLDPSQEIVEQNVLRSLSCDR